MRRCGIGKVSAIRLTQFLSVNGEAVLSMKAWQLVVILDNDMAMLQAVASSKQEWRQLEALFAAFGELVRHQERSELDRELPDDFVRRVLSSSTKVCFLSKDGWLRSWRMSADDEVVSAVDAYVKYGGAALERVYESGAVAVP
jgi:hypothetical protein